MAPSATPGNRPRPLTILAAAFLAGGAAAVGLNHYLDVYLSQRKPVVESEPIFIAMRSLPSGAPITVWDVALRNWPKAMLPTTAMRVEDSFEGMQLKMPLREGQPLLSVQLEPALAASKMAAEPGDDGEMIAIDDRTKIQMSWPTQPPRTPATPATTDTTRVAPTASQPISAPSTAVVADDRLSIPKTSDRLSVQPEEDRLAVRPQDDRLSVRPPQDDRLSVRPVTQPEPVSLPPVVDEPVAEPVETVALTPPAATETPAMPPADQIAEAAPPTPATAPSEPVREPIPEIQIPSPVASQPTPSLQAIADVQPTPALVTTATPTAAAAVAAPAVTAPVSRPPAPRPAAERVASTQPVAPVTPAIVPSQRHLVVPERIAVMVDEVTASATPAPPQNAPQPASEQLRRLTPPAASRPAVSSKPTMSVVRPAQPASPAAVRPNPLRSQTARPAQLAPVTTQTRPLTTQRPASQTTLRVPPVAIPTQMAPQSINQSAQNAQSDLNAEADDAEDAPMFPRMSARIEKVGEDWTRFRQSIFGSSEE